MKKKSVGRLWIRLWKGHRVTRDLALPCEREDVQAVLREGMHEMDLSVPVWLPRHQADWNEFSLTRFRPEHFLESVDFDWMELSYIFPEDEKKPPRRDEVFD